MAAVARATASPRPDIVRITTAPPDCASKHIEIHKVLTVNRVSGGAALALILDFPPPLAPVEAEGLRRIRRLSGPLEWLFAGLFIVGAALLTIAVLAVLFYGGDRLQIRPGGMQIYVEATVPPPPPGWTTVGVIPLVRKVALATSATLMIGPALAILWQLRRLFRLYGAGVILEARNARIIGLIAGWLVAYAVAPALGHLVVEAAGFDDEGWLRLDSLQALVLGLVLFVIARVMRWGADVADDASRFV